MIAPAIPVRRPNVLPAWQDGFLSMLPRIRRYARIAFRTMAAEAREEAVAEVLANALVAYVRLVQLDKASLAYPTVLARYAVAQFHGGRRVGSPLNSRDVLAGVAQRRHGFAVQRLDHYDPQARACIEATVEDTRTPVPETAAFRCDFPRWLAGHTPRNRRIAAALAVGHSTNAVARRFGLSAGRISQLRGAFERSWLQFHGQGPHAVSGSVRGAIAARRRDGQPPRPAGGESLSRTSGH